MALNSSLSSTLHSILEAKSTPVPAVDDVTTVLSVLVQPLSDDIPEFEIILPVIFGVFMILSLGLIVFYTKAPDEKVVQVGEQYQLNGINTIREPHSGIAETQFNRP